LILCESPAAPGVFAANPNYRQKNNTRYISKICCHHRRDALALSYGPRGHTGNEKGKQPDRHIAWQHTVGRKGRKEPPCGKAAHTDDGA